jgi:hypothetical protein
MVETHNIDSRTLFTLSPMTENAGRVYVLSGRSAELANKYLSLKLAVAEFSKLGDPVHFLYSAPIIATALRKSGHPREAIALLAFAEEQAKLKAVDGTPLSSILLARVYAAQGKKDEALPLLNSAVNRGWLPQPPLLPVDLHNDPALERLKGDARFEKARTQILGTLARERAQVNLDLLRRAVAAN